MAKRKKGGTGGAAVVDPTGAEAGLLASASDAGAAIGELATRVARGVGLAGKRATKKTKRTAAPGGKATKKAGGRTKARSTKATKKAKSRPAARKK